MANINVITAPDMLHNQAVTFCLIQPSENIKSQTQKLIENFDDPVNIYLYDPTAEDERDWDWLLNAARLADYTILDVDNLDPMTRNFASYFISLPNVFYLTNDEYTPYNKLSVNRVYNLDWLYEKIIERGSNG